MKRRFWAGLLSFVMLWSLLPVSAAAEGHEPTIEWGGSTPLDYTLSVQVFYENEGLQWEKTETEKHFWVDVHPASGTEVYEADSDGGSYIKGTGHFTFGPTKASLKLFTRSTAGHNVTVKYVFDDASGKTRADAEKAVKYLDSADFEIVQDNYEYTAAVTKGDATFKITGKKLEVTGGTQDSEITVTYTPEDNYIYIDEYFDNGGIFSKWTGGNIRLNGHEFVDNNALPKKYVIENHKLAPAMEDYRFLTVTNADNSTTVYDFSYAVAFPKTSESTKMKIKDVWYDRDAGKWYYSYNDLLGLLVKFSLINEGGVNFCYNTVHTENSERHKFNQLVKTVPATCTEKGYTVYKCAYCTKTEKRDYTGPLGHQWGDWVHVDDTEGAASMHQKVCQRSGCGEKGTPVMCDFEETTAGTITTFTCKVCRHSYQKDSSLPTTPVYVYVKTVNPSKGVVGIEGVKPNGNTGGLATLGKLETTTTVTPANKDTLGAEVIRKQGFTPYSENSSFNVNLIKSWDALYQEIGAPGYDDEEGKMTWRLDGTVHGYRAIYCDSDGTELEGFAPNTDPKYYLKGATGIGVSTDGPATVPAGKEFDCWATEDENVTVTGNTFIMPDHDVIFTPKWKTGTLEIRKVLEDNSPATGNTFSFTVTPVGSTSGTDTQITGAGNATISDLLIGNYTVAENANTAAVNGYRCATQYSTDNINWQNDPITVTVPSNDTVTVYVRNSYTPEYSVTYTDGVGGAAFANQTYPNILRGAATPAFVGTPERDGYTFRGWDPAFEATVTKNVTYTATWTRNSSGDDDDKYYFAIQKVDAQDGHALNGAKFELYQLDKNDKVVNRRVVETRQQSSKNGIALFSVDNKKSYDGIWYYAEVSAPEGYVLDRTEYEISDKDFFDSLSTAVKYADTVRNYRGTTPDLLNDSDHFAYVIGYMDGNVRPYGLISRAETTTIFFRLLKDSVRDGNLLTSNTYTDVADDYWANIAISTMTGLGIVQGRSTTTFDPKAPITRAQFAAICARFDTGKSSGTQTFTDIKGHWAEKYIERAAELGWIKGFEDGTFRPDTYITRAQAMTMINRVLNRIPEENGDLLSSMNVWPDCNPGDWFYLAVQEATNSHDYKHKAGNYETWTSMNKDPDWTRYEN